MSGAERLLKSVLYSLKRAFPGRIVLCRRVDLRVNVETGVKLTDFETKVIERAIVLPSTIHREFAYDLAFIAAAKNFTYGAQFDTSQRRIIIDRRDISFEPALSDFIVYDNRRYEIKEISEFEFRAGYLLTLKLLVGPTNGAIYPLTLFSTVHLTSETAPVGDLEPLSLPVGQQLLVTQSIVATTVRSRTAESLVQVKHHD